MARETYNQISVIPLEDIKIGTVLAPTDARAIPWDGGQSRMVFNQDMLPGPINPGDPDRIWLAKRTVPGSNGTKFTPVQYKIMPYGKPACFSVMLTADEQGQVFFELVSAIPTK